MEPEIRPEPSPEQRAAILAALERLLAEDSLPPAYRSSWREAGILENLYDPDDYGATARPRSNPGATRA